MSSRDKRRRKREQQRLREALARIQEQALAQNKEPQWRTVAGFVGAILGAISAIVGIYLFVHDALHTPEIHAPIGVVDNPFALPISLRNPSIFFDMKNMKFLCNSKRIVLADRNVFEGGSFSQLAPPASIHAGHTVEYTCPFDQEVQHSERPVLEAQIEIEVSFTTLGYPRKSISEEFTWTAATHRWIEGTIVN